MLNPLNEMSKPTRMLVNFITNGETYTVSFAYYYGGEWTGINETAELTEEQLYNILKPVLKIEIKTEYLREDREDIWDIKINML